MVEIKSLDNEIMVLLCNFKTIWGGMVFNATFNNISVISWRPGLLVAETRVPGEDHRPAARH
jgi:hypothetical protein